MNSRKVHAYNSGVMDIYQMQEKPIDGTDAKKYVLKNMHMRVWYQEISVFDHLRAAFEQSGKEVTLKVRIPEYRKLDSTFYCRIDGKWHQVYNSAHITSDGFRETELTLIAPQDIHPEVDDD